jgi:photosystem II stability/assembly factor-like uncharacterized protein
MRLLLALTVLGALSCGQLFVEERNIPSGLSCADGGVCPPGQVCSSTEGVCRFTCKTPRPNCLPEGGNTNNTGNNGGRMDCGCPNNQAQFVCDADLLCREACGQNPGTQPACAQSGSTAGCPTNLVCDPRWDVCRPLCTGASCSGGWSCGAIGDTTCDVCLPPDENISVVDGGVDGGTASFSQVTATVPTGSLNAIYAPDASVIYAVGAAGSFVTLTQSGSGYIASTSFVPAGTSSPPDLNAIFSVAEQLYVAGASGYIATKPIKGGTWSQLTTTTQAALYGLAGSSLSNLWAVGDNNTILYFNGAAWVPQSSPAPSSTVIRGVWAASPSEVYAVGDSGLFFSTQDGGTAWMSASPLPVSNPGSLRAIWGFTSGSIDLWIAGDNGGVYHSPSGAGGWEDHTYNNTGPSQPSLTALWGSSDEDLWVVGGGLVLHRGTPGSTGEWTSYTTTASSRPLNGVWGVGAFSAQQQVYICGGDGTLLVGF